MVTPKDIFEVVGELVEHQMTFSVHYPTPDSVVFTIRGPIDNNQLSVLAAIGASHGPNGTFMILVTLTGAETEPISSSDDSAEVEVDKHTTA
jgi:hypothetical protein